MATVESAGTTELPTLASGAPRPTMLTLLLASAALMVMMGLKIQVSQRISMFSIQIMSAIPFLGYDCLLLPGASYLSSGAYVKDGKGTSLNWARLHTHMCIYIPGEIHCGQGKAIGGVPGTAVTYCCKCCIVLD